MNYRVYVSVICVKAVCNDIVPPTINQEEVDSEINPKINLTPNVAQKRKVNYALSNSFGFGGTNASIIVKEFN